MRIYENNDLSRREMLKTGIAGAGAMMTFGFSQAAADKPDDAYGGFKMGVQSYSLRGFDAKTALAHTKRSWPPGDVSRTGSAV